LAKLKLQTDALKWFVSNAQLRDWTDVLVEQTAVDESITVSKAVDDFKAQVLVFESCIIIFIFSGTP
jgi:hypothetical protein